MRGSIAIIAFAAGAIAGCPDPAFRCSSSAECNGDRDDGFCEPNGYCSFEDPDCESGRRYGELAGSLAFQCVPPRVAGTGTDTASIGGSAATGETTVADVGSDDLVDDTRGVNTSGPALTTTSTEGPGGTTVSDSGKGDVTDEDTSVSTAGEPLTMSFGERLAADVQGVTEDTFLSTWNPTYNNGAHVDLHIQGGGQYSELSLLKFELSALPEGATIVDATLHIVNEDEFGPGEVTVHTLNLPWSQGMEDLDPGEPNWTMIGPLDSWPLPGAQGMAHNEAVVGSFELADPRTEYAVPIDAEVVQAWADAPDDNNGLLFQSLDVEDVVYFSSSETSYDEQAPLLVVRYWP